MILHRYCSTSKDFIPDPNFNIITDSRSGSYLCRRLKIHSTTSHISSKLSSEVVEIFFCLPEGEITAHADLINMKLAQDFKIHPNVFSSSLTMSSNPSNSSMPTLPIEVMNTIMLYIMPRELFDIAFLSNTLSCLVTFDMVIKSALIKGGNAQTTVSEMFRLVQDGAIYPPSPLRLLRLVNGRVCQICSRDKKVLEPRKVNHVRKGYGIFCCWWCCAKRQFSKAFQKQGEVFAKNSTIIKAIQATK